MRPVRPVRRAPVVGADVDTDLVHREAAVRVARLGQRYTTSRRSLVEAIVAAERPMTVPEVVAATHDVPTSSAYRNITVLHEAGVLRRVAGSGDHGHFELAEDLVGHHHHFLCGQCGSVADVAVSPELERALAEAAQAVADEQGVEVTDHSFDLMGRCATCR